MIKAFFFDLGGVVFTNGTKKFSEDIAKRFNLDKELVLEVMDRSIGSDYRENKISREEFWQRVFEKLHIDGDMDKLEEEWIDGYQIIEGTKEIILELAKKYQVFYLSDNTKSRVESLDKRYAFKQWFVGGVFSYEVGFRKPNPEIYRLAAEIAGVSPAESVFIDDKAPFLEPAKQIGMTTFLFETPEKLREDLTQKELL